MESYFNPSGIIKIGISACLVGKRVRYDSKDSQDPYIVNTIGRYVKFVPVCPESEAGFGIPREPMILFGSVKNPRLLKRDTKEDATKKLITWALKKIEELKRERILGYIFKSKSPSCGKHKVKIYTKEGSVVRKGSGIFKSIFEKELPFVPILDEEEFQNQDMRDDFFVSVFLIKRWYERCSRRKDIDALKSFHRENRFIFLSRSSSLFDEISQLLEKKVTKRTLYNNYLVFLSEMINKRSSISRHVKIMKQIIGLLKDSLTLEERELLQSSLLKYRKGDIPFIMPITLINHYAMKYDKEELLSDYYVNPEPLELKIRNHV